jgi:hypothetical protein
MGASTVRIRTWFTSLAAALGLMLSVSTAQATPLVAGSGWQFDEISISNAASANSPWTFTLTTSGVFSIVDSFIAGDTYDVFDVGGLLVTTTFAAAPTYWTPVGDPADFNWVNLAYSRGQILLGPGSYAFDVFGNTLPGGVPAGLYVRLDAITEVPAPGALALLAVGLTGLLVARRRLAA